MQKVENNSSWGSRGKKTQRLLDREEEEVEKVSIHSTKEGKMSQRADQHRWHGTVLWKTNHISHQNNLKTHEEVATLCIVTTQPCRTILCETLTSLLLLCSRTLKQKTQSKKLTVQSPVSEKRKNTPKIDMACEATPYLHHSNSPTEVYKPDSNS